MSSMASVQDSGLAEQRLNFGDICKFKNVNSPTWSKKDVLTYVDGAREE